jgi:RNA polymerase sigma-70 factor (ECF subfamily)
VPSDHRGECAHIFLVLCGPTNVGPSMSLNFCSRETVGAPRAQPPEEPGNATERVWIERIRSGDETAFDAMLGTYYKPLVLFAAHCLGCEREEAPDVVHDMLLRVWENRAHWVVRVSLATYLHGATRNRCVDYLRHRLIEKRWCQAGSSASDVDPDMLAIVGRTTIAADSLAEANDIDCAVARAIARLPIRRRQTFILHWDRHLTYAEIATVMGTSRNTVRVQIGRSLKSLRLTLAPQMVMLVGRPVHF